MTSRFRDENAVVFRFGGGLHTRASEDQIDPIEAAGGANFLLDPGNGEFRPRKPFDKIGTVPNAGEIRGFASLHKTTGESSLLVQAGSTVYEWDGLTTFTSRGTVSASAKLRGTIDANWPLDDVVIITDLNLAEEVHTWDGTTLSQTTFTTDGSTAFGTFRAKYCLVDNERAFFGNIHDNGTNSPHLLVCSKGSDYKVISSAVRPDSGNGATDPWFLPLPQFRPINGIAQGFGIIAVSQEHGAFEKLTGSDATDFALVKLHRGSGASGDEAVVSTGNDVLYGRSGRIESLLATDKFGDVEIADPSFRIADQLESVESWSVYYNPRLHRVYCFPGGGSSVWVGNVDMFGGDVSPWVEWTTQHALAFQPTAAMIGFDPQNDLEYLFMGDGSGNVYRMEGTGLAGDGGSASLKVSRRTVQFSAPLDAKAFRISGWVKSRKNLANTLVIRLKFAGEHVHDSVKSVSLPAVTFTPAWGGFYWGGDYWNAQFRDRFIRNLWAAPGLSNEVQLELEVEGVNDFAIAEVGVRFDAAS